MEYTDLILYRPEGIRDVRHVLFLISDEKSTEIQNLTYNGDQEGADKLFEEH